MAANRAFSSSGLRRSIGFLGAWGALTERNPSYSAANVTSSPAQYLRNDFTAVMRKPIVFGE